MASKAAGASDGLFSPPGLGEQVLPVAAIYGANASGKTAVLKAFEFLAKAVKFSHTHWQPDQRIPVEPFAVNDPALASDFSVDFLLAGIRHQYGFAASAQAVLREWLYAYPKGKKQLWFERVKNAPIAFGAKLPGENKAIEGLTRCNSLFLSAAAQNNHAALAPIYGWFSQAVSFATGHLPLAARGTYNTDVAEVCQDEAAKATIVRLLTHADLGIADVHVEDVPWPRMAERILEVVREELQTLNPLPQLPDTQRVIRLLHRFDHRVGQVPVSNFIPFEAEQESRGTLAYLSLLGPIVRLLRSGGILAIDELDASLHTLMAVQIIRLFGSPASNPRSAQLIFNTHDTNLLSSGDLRRDQVWFTEKDSEGSSHLYPLTDFKPRRQENLENGYLQGRYGAIPFIHPDYLTGIAGGNGEKS